MSIHKKSIEIKKTASYCVSGNVKTAKKIWFVLHGYGMLAEYFIKKFDGIIDDETCVIAPEGLSKFYTQGFNGRVGATWMTKQDRTEEITDYINYLNALYQEIVNTNNEGHVKINLLGFSQGGATVSRWAAAEKVSFNNLILWSSAFPEDISFKTLMKKNCFVLVGNKDEFASEKNILRQKERLKNSDLNVKMIDFEGPHDIPTTVLIEQIKANNW